MTDETVTLHVGEEHAVRLAPRGGSADWAFDVSGMSSAVEVRRMWVSRPYEEDEDDPVDVPPRAMVFIIRAVAAGDALVHFRSTHGDRRDVAVTVGP
jgi:hypothetical protein